MELVEQLDQVKVSVLAEYLCARLGLEKDETELHLQFKDGRYDRMRRLARLRGR